MRRTFHPLGLTICICLLAASASARGAEWGDLTMRFVYDGDAPQPTPLTITKDPQVCGKYDLVDESLVVNPENGGIANVVVHIYLGRRDKKPPVHESYAKTANAKVLLDNKGCRFEPRIATMRPTNVLVVANSDTVGHNTKIDTLSPANTPINYTVPTGEKFEKQFEVEERIPATVGCSIHPWMKGYVFIKDTPYIAVSDKDGKLTIKNLPVGEWTFQFWQEQSGYVDKAKLNGKPVEWDKGRPTIEIKPGANDFGELKLAPKLFEE